MQLFLYKVPVKNAPRAVTLNIFANEKLFISFAATNGGLAQLARAFAWHARGHRFDSDILHKFAIRLLDEFLKALFFCSTAS
jgi:hypothetical protein